MFFIRLQLLLAFVIAGTLFGQSSQVIQAVKTRTVLIVTKDKFGQILGHGSGFLVGGSGEIATNYHVVENAASATVKFSVIPKEFPVQSIIAKDPLHDLAILRIKFKFRNAPAPLRLLGRDAMPKVGERVLAFGNPKGLEGTVSDGIVSSIRNVGPDFAAPLKIGAKVIQISAPISPGSSGGPIVNESGVVVGVATFVRTDGQNLNFAVPASTLWQLREKGDRKLPFNTANLAPLLPAVDEVRSDIDSIKAEIEREAWERALKPEDIERLYQEAAFLKDKGDYHLADAKMTLVFGTLNRQGIKDQEAQARYLQLHCAITLGLEDADRTISLASQLFDHASQDVHKGYSHGYLGRAFLIKAQYDQAIEHFQKALPIMLEKLAPEHGDVANAYNNLGIAYDRRGSYAEAIAYYEKALAIYLKLGPESANVSAIYNNIGMAFDNKGETQKAIDYYKESLAIKMKTIGPKHPDVATTYNNLGLAYAKINDPKRAVAYLEKCLEINVKAFGEEHPAVGLACANLGDVYDQNGLYDKAIEFYNAALNVKLKTLGPDHPDILSIYVLLANAYGNKGSYDEAIEIRRRILDINLNKLGPEDQNIGIAYNDLGLAYDNKGDHPQAIAHYNKALAIYFKKLGSEHPNVGITYHNIAFSFGNKGDHEKAIAYFGRSLPIKVKNLGSEHPDVATNYHYTGLAYKNKGDHDKAIEWHEKALAINLKNLGPENSTVAIDYSEIGDSHHQKGTYEKAISCYEKSLAIQLKILGPDHPDTKRTNNNLALARRRSNQP
jgi:tetratricopeptide (TPR) repeat protein